MCQGKLSAGHSPKSAAGQGDPILGLAPSGTGA